MLAIIAAVAFGISFGRAHRGHRHRRLDLHDRGEHRLCHRVHHGGLRGHRDVHARHPRRHPRTDDARRAGAGSRREHPPHRALGERPAAGGADAHRRADAPCGLPHRASADRRHRGAAAGAARVGHRRAPGRARPAERAHRVQPAARLGGPARRRATAHGFRAHGAARRGGADVGVGAADDPRCAQVAADALGEPCC